MTDTLPQDKVDRWIDANGEKAYDTHYALWLVYFDREVQRAVGMSFLSLEDWLTHDAYKDEMSPREAATQFLGDIGLFS